MLVRMYRKGNPCALLGLYTAKATMENSTEVPKKKLKIELLYDPAILLLGIYPKEISTNLEKFLHLHVHSSIIYNS